MLDHPALNEFEHEQFRDILSERVTQGKLEEALGNLCKWIYKATKRQTVILLDEYDVPLQKAAIHDIHIIIKDRHTLVRRKVELV